MAFFAIVSIIIVIFFVSDIIIIDEINRDLIPIDL